MQVTAKAYKVWRVLFEYPNTWLDLGFISRELDMSNRQTSSVIQTMNSPYIHKSESSGSKSVEVMLEVTDEELKELKRDVLMTFHEIDDTVIENIRATLSPIGWTSAKDIALMTGYRGSRIYVAISLMDDVKSKDSGSSRLYKICAREGADTTSFKILSTLSYGRYIP